MYIVIETHGGAEYATICTDTDGNNLVFDNLSDAQSEADDCQDGLVVNLDGADKEETAGGWSAEDVRNQAAQDAEDLTDEEVNQVMKYLIHKSDASVGINWDTISMWIDKVIDEREVEGNMLKESDVPTYKAYLYRDIILYVKEGQEYREAMDVLLELRDIGHFEDINNFRELYCYKGWIYYRLRTSNEQYILDYPHHPTNTIEEMETQISNSQ